MIVRIPKIVPEAPAWADTFGVDVYGVFAGITAGQATQLLRWIEPGTFLMGSPADERGRYDDEGPQHKVTIPHGFWLGQTPVTQAFYEAATGSNPSNFKHDARRPVERVSWEDAGVFCSKLSGQSSDLDDTVVRLPSEAEWEYACRAGTVAAMCNGRELTSDDGACPNLDELAWYGKNAKSTTHPVGQKAPNAWGLYDMLGNVWEWCEDVWHDNYSGAPADGSVWLGDGRDRVCRGGSWAYLARLCRCAYRNHWEPGYRINDLGFRLVLAAKVEEDIRPFS